MAGAGIRGADYIPANKVKAFKTLFDKVRGHVGSHDGARAYIGLGGSAVDDLHKGKVSATTAKKILDAYNKINK